MGRAISDGWTGWETQKRAFEEEMGFAEAADVVVYRNAFDYFNESPLLRVNSNLNFLC